MDSINENPILVISLRIQAAGAESCSNAIYLNRQRAEDFVMGMVSKVVLEEGHLERYYQLMPRAT